MSQDHLGLFDTPPSRNQIRSSLAIVGLLLAVFILSLTVRDVHLAEFDAFIPMVDAVTTLVDLIIAILLYVQATVFRSRALTALGSGFIFTALILVPHVLTFPGAFSPDGLLGAGTSTTAWLYVFWRAAFPTAVLLYVLYYRADASVAPGGERPAANVAMGLLAAIALTAAVTVLTTAGHDWLPPLYRNRSEADYAHTLTAGAVTIALSIVALGLLIRQRKSVLDMWLLVVLAAWLVQTLLFTAPRGRFTVSWYSAVVVVLLSHLVVMLALIAESSRLYARLAMSTAAQKREREARLMSLDAVTAAVAHEVGQPLTAVTTHAAVGLHSLDRAEPDVEAAIQALRAISESGHRTFDVIRSIRAMFAKGPGPASEFSLNELVRETASLMDMELSAKKASLELALDDAIPPILADRVQMQRVLVNLFSNAIESLGATRKRPRHIAIRSAMLDGKGVLLEVSDTGIGIAPEELEHIFDAFFTTKATGTGLGLSLCRTIVEEHGGRLWASPGEECGMTFHLQLPNSSMP